MNARSILGAALVALAAITYAADATASDRDKDKDKNKPKAACEILTAQEVEADEKLVITGTGLTLGTTVPEVFFAGVALPVDGATLTPTRIEADLHGFVLDPETKDYLLAIRRSPGDKGCPAHLVTVVRQVQCPAECLAGLVAFGAQLPAESTGSSLCDFDVNRLAGFVVFDPHLPGGGGADAHLQVLANRCFAQIEPDPAFVNLDITNRQQAACAPLAKAILVDKGFTTRTACDISP
jgi:hypothetical protein